MALSTLGRRGLTSLRPLYLQGAAWSRHFSQLQVPHRAQNFIANQWCDGEGGRTFVVQNPATEQDLFTCARAGVADVEAAVKAARECFHGPNWGKQSSGKARAEILRKMAASLRDNKEEWSILETLDNGKPINESRADMDVCIGLFDYYADFAERFDTEREEKIDVKSDPDFEGRLVREPVGVVGMVTPWNFPLMQSAAKVAPALAAGCTMVLKPSPYCVATSLRLGELALEAGLPAGALNILAGEGEDVGNAILNHPRVDVLSFTGSARTGKIVLKAAADKLVPSTIELGGKGAIVVFDDVDIEAAVDWIMIGIFYCTGQVCSCTSRLIVHEDLEEKLLARLVEEAKKIPIGDPLLEDTKMGPLTFKEQFDKVVGFVERAKADGAEILCGGDAPSGPGYYFPPTVMKTAVGSEAWREEIFGPVLAVQSFKTEAEAVQMANDTPYGLGNAVLCKDEARCERVAQQLHAGVVWKNCSQPIPMECPFGGFGSSGFGKEYGAMGFDEYVRTKVITSCAPGFTWGHYVAPK